MSRDKTTPNDSYNKINDYYTDGRDIISGDDEDDDTDAEHLKT